MRWRLLSVCTAALACAALVAVPTSRAAPPPCGGSVLAHLTENSLRLVDAKGQQRTIEDERPALALASWLSPPTWAPDGRRLAYSRTVSNVGPVSVTSELVVAEVSTGFRSTVLTLPVNQWIYEVAWSPRGDRLALTVITVNTVVTALTFTGLGDRSTVWVVRPDGTGLRPVSSGLGVTYDYGPSWAPDGHRLAYLSQGLVHVVDTRASTPSAPPLDVREGDAWGVRWSPDGTRLAAIRRPFTTDPLTAVAYRPDDLLLMKPDGSARRTAVRGYHLGPPTWHPDGRSVLVAQYPGTWPPLWTDLVSVDPATGRSRVLLRKPGVYLINPMWSPDGKLLLANRRVPNADRGDREELVLLDRRGRDRLVLRQWSWGATWCPRARLG